MSKKDKQSEADLNRINRGNDGFFYVVILKNGTILNVGDHDGIQAITARWSQLGATFATGETSFKGFLTFSGCRAEAEGPIIGAGCVVADQVLAIQDDQGDDEETDEEVYDDDEEDEPRVVILQPKPTPVPVSDAELEAEPDFKTGVN